MGPRRRDRGRRGPGQRPRDRARRTRPTKVDLRVVSATHESVERSADFRADLYARLAGFTHVLPLLRERQPDLGLLVADLLRELAPERAPKIRFTPEALRALLSYDFPLNVARAPPRPRGRAVFGPDADGDDVVGLAALPDVLRRPPSAKPAAEPSPKPLSAADAALKEQLAQALHEHQGNVSEVARSFAKTRMQIHRWMKRFGLDPGTHRQ